MMDFRPKFEVTAIQNLAMSGTDVIHVERNYLMRLVCNVLKGDTVTSMTLYNLITSIFVESD